MPIAKHTGFGGGGGWGVFSLVACMSLLLQCMSRAMSRWLCKPLTAPKSGTQEKNAMWGFVRFLVTELHSKEGEAPKCAAENAAWRFVPQGHPAAQAA